MLRKLLVILAILGAMVLGAETALTYLAQRGMEEAFEKQYGLEEDLRVAINSFPFIVSLARNHIRELRLEWRGEIHFVSGDVDHPLPCSLEISMQDVELDMPSVLRGRLVIRSLSYLSSRLLIGIADLVPLLGGGIAVPGGVEGSSYMATGEVDFEYKVEIYGDKSICFTPIMASTQAQRLPSKDQPSIEGMAKIYSLEGIPLRFSLLSAVLRGGFLDLKLDIKEWRE
ncbi:MAG: LmeA family phospholipid-binding protein [Actinomycetota bacterium]